MGSRGNIGKSSILPIVKTKGIALFFQYLPLPQRAKCCRQRSIRSMFDDGNAAGCNDIAASDNVGELKKVRIELAEIDDVPDASSSRRPHQKGRGFELNKEFQL